jgi:hypothetical protein
MKIGILGSGAVGQVLGKGWAAGSKASVGSFAKAAAFGEAILFAPLGTAAEEVIRLAGPENFKGKLVMDATNPLDFSKGMPPSLFVGWNDSLGERVQKWLPEAHVVKAFNTIGNAHMVKPDFNGQKPDLLICGNDEAAKALCGRLCADLGMPTVDLGPIQLSRGLEEMCILWVAYGIKTQSWNHAFKLLRK